MSDIKFNCPHCNQKLEALQEMLGESTDCPSCKRSITVPSIAPETTDEEPAPLSQPTRPCPFCSEEILDTAIKCKHCGEFLDGSNRKSAPVQNHGRKCPKCGAYGVGKVRGLQGAGEVFLCLILLAFLLIPGIIYYVYIESVPYCSACGNRV